MSSISMPSPAQVPQSPTEDDEAKRQRQIASDTAIADAKSTGRGSTIIGGAVIARDQQAARLKARQAAAADLGL